MNIDAITVTAAATAVYGFATLLLWIENLLDRKARDQQFRAGNEAQKQRELYSAFYEAWGYWRGSRARSPNSLVDAAQSGRVFEAFIRLECQLRLNGYTAEANSFGVAARTLQGIDEQLASVGISLKLIPREYRITQEVGSSVQR